ncbi:hypothetical protein RchiOBHm_Chr4g0390981 [Rosa chinensis]|uniref:Uncharacterized protein n=1 Tax=Rosa chinensis TaxID=74649 RepID=A0A2P6QQC2_ROSCH|nr:hypothetical protein RchiOBHm_Chr4g0390981 [Rosa chinensis]
MNGMRRCSFCRVERMMMDFLIDPHLLSSVWLGENGKKIRKWLRWQHLSGQGGKIR